MRPHVTDHAVLRYLERARGFDIEAVRRHIAELCEAPVEAGANCVKAEGVRFEINNRAVVTCTPNGGFSRTKQHKFAMRSYRAQDSRLQPRGEREA